MNYLVEAIGFLGAGLLLLAYFQLSRDHWASRSYHYQLTNVAASLLLVIYSVAKFAYANVLLNSIWLIIAVIAVFALLRSRRS